MGVGSPIPPLGLLADQHGSLLPAASSIRFVEVLVGVFGFALRCSVIQHAVLVHVWVVTASARYSFLQFLGVAV